MTKITLNAFSLSLLALLAVACGDAGDAQFDEDPGFGEELVGEEGDANLEDGDGNDDEQNPGEEEVVDGPACGDGILDADEQCDDGNSEDADGCSSACELEALEVEGQISIDIIIDDLNSNEDPLEDSCSGAIELEIDNGQVAGEGRCFLDANANFLDYVLDADVDANGVVTGEIDVILNGKSHILAIEGLLDNGVLSLEFDGVTLVIQNIRAIWNGKVHAELN
jgi:cysteine-rich repeat protein